MDSSSEHLKDIMNEYEPDDNGYYDKVGGYHKGGIGWNPHGIWHGECSHASCEGCPYEHDIKDIF